MDKMKILKFISFLLIVHFTACDTQQLATQNKETVVASTPTLDGRTFLIESFNPDGSKSGEEYIYFKSGTIEGSECNKYGYDKPAYTCEKSGENMAFKATMSSAKEGTLAWNGSITGSNMTGTSLWAKEGQNAMTITYKGKEVTK
jgi:hypothetical protein